MSLDSTKALLWELHKLIARGQGDGPEAEAICDQLDPLWRRLSAEERERARRLSAEFYELHGG